MTFLWTLDVKDLMVLPHFILSMILDTQKYLANQESGLAEPMRQVLWVETSNCQNDLKLSHISVSFPLDHHYISAMPIKLTHSSGNNQFQKNLKISW